MLDINDIVRTPIKLRKPIFMDFCDCWSARRLHIDGQLHYIIGDDFDLDGLEKLLNTVDYCVGMIFREDIEGNIEKIRMCLSRNIPVCIRTSKVLPQNLLEMLSRVSHCSVQTIIELPSKFSGNSLEDSSWRKERVQPVRDMLISCKSKMMNTSVSLEYNPLIHSLFDMYNMVEYLRSGMRYVELDIPMMPDDVYKRDIEPYNNDVKKYYYADVPTRSWKIQESVDSTITNEMYKFLKSRKIPMERVRYSEDISDCNVIRYTSSGLSNLPSGMPQFIYRKSASGIFKENPYPMDGYICPCCGEVILPKKGQ